MDVLLAVSSLDATTRAYGGDVGELTRTPPLASAPVEPSAPPFAPMDTSDDASTAQPMPLAPQLLQCDTRGGALSSQSWSLSSSFEAVPSVSYASAKSHQVVPTVAGLSQQSTLHLAPPRAFTSPMLRSPSSVSSTTRPAIAKSPVPKFRHHKEITDTRPHRAATGPAPAAADRSGKNYFLRALVCVGALLLIGGIGVAIYASLNPCSLVRCHERASVCINRFPFWAQCVCDAGYVGNGKTHCSECGRRPVFYGNGSDSSSAAAAASLPNGVRRIVGGTEALAHSWPFTAYLVQSYKGRYVIKGLSYLISYTWTCGGTIINHKTVLTAAHCVHDHSFEYQHTDNDLYSLVIHWNEWYRDVESTLDVYVGVHDVKALNLSQKMRTRKVNKHEQYDEYSLNNDIATIQLADFIESTVATQYACLPLTFSSDFPAPSQFASGHIVGWGRVNEHGPASSVLKNSVIRIYNEAHCAHIEVGATKNWMAQMCAGALDGSTDTCQGDSGGGLFVFDNLIDKKRLNGSNGSLSSGGPTPVRTLQCVVAGIVSYGDGCARVGKPGIYTRSSFFLDWIRKNSDF